MDKIVVLAAGLGTRMRGRDGDSQLNSRQSQVAETGVKAMIPMGRPFLDYVLSRVADAGYRRVCLVVSPNHDELRSHYANLSGGRLTFEFAVQPDPLGTAHALACAAEFVGSDPFAVINSDNYYPVSAFVSLAQLTGAGTVAFSCRALVRDGNIDAVRVARFAVLTTDDHDDLNGIIEKPDAASAATLTEASLISMNCWRFGPAIFEACQRIERSTRGEYEMADAVTFSMQQLGQRYRVVRSDETVLDLSSRHDIASVAARLKNEEVRL